MSEISSHTAIIDLWPSLTSFAEDIGQSYNTAKAIRRRGWIPDWYWEATVRGAEKRKIKGVTLARLAEIATQRAPKAEAAA